MKQAVVKEVGVILAAGGKGSRFGKQGEKIFLALRGKSLLHFSLSVFEQNPSVTEIVLVVPNHLQARVAHYLRKRGCRCSYQVVVGGKTRFASVQNGLKTLNQSARWVLVHDVARPLLTQPLLKRILETLARYRSAVPVVPLVDTMKWVDKSHVKETLPRAQLFSAQTPQGFLRETLEQAYQQAVRDRFIGTDEASLLEHLGKRVRVLPGEPWNLKITVPTDLQLAAWWLGQLKKGRVYG